ncbi:protein serine/threonine phosphatase 2C [Massarina eburnea CBS 473.64]|uniref:Protein serine/threonine phosphatase 2C n=1 Tax=Massarina eburnea CBS 473.64 TaxID=1395130 RepID=A0A6A6RQA7_9PLEO|nr:protein serine/threonine phosphatase 2C [Massarina eburnea CBS 473.64]
MMWRAAARQLNAQNASSSSRIQSIAAGNRTFLRATNPRTCIHVPALGRVRTLSSRVSSSPHPSPTRQHSSLITKILRSSHSWSTGKQPTVIHSAFPTKTFVFFLLVGGIAYYFVDIKLKDFSDQITQAFIGDLDATPLHFYNTREEVDHVIQYHIPDLSALLKDSDVLRQINERFKEMAFGWELTEEEAAQCEMPVTHGCRFKSNEPCEDYFAIGTAPGPGNKPWNYWSIFDGHAGRGTALYLQSTMHPFLSRALSSLSPSSPSTQIHSTIKSVFTNLDNELMNRAQNAAKWYPATNAAAIAALTPAFSGSCALVATFDPEQGKLRVACTGDSRAVLGRWDNLEGKYIVQALSVDQTGFNEAEVARIEEAHPGEHDILSAETGRLLGLAVTRAFGDHRWKWDNAFIKQCQIKFWGTAPRPQSKTPPYLTAEPEVTETDIVRVDPKAENKRSDEKSDFMIMASDGLWDHMSSEVAVQCVQSWLEARERGNGTVLQDPKANRPVFNNSFNLDPGVELDVEEGKEVTWQAEPKYFAIEDDNVAVCLTRNAMGGNRRGLLVALSIIPGPISRSAVDDTTVMVVFFDKVAADGKKGGNGDGDGGKKKRWLPW